MIKLLIGLFLSSFIFCHSFCLAESGNPVIDGKTATKVVATDFDITSVTDGYIPYVASGDVDKSPVYTDGTKIGRGTTTLDENVHWEVETTKTDSWETILRLTHTTSGTPSLGIGVGIDFEQETSVGNNEIIGRIIYLMESVTAGSEKATCCIKLQSAGDFATDTIFKVNKPVQAGATGIYIWCQHSGKTERVHVGAQNSGGAGSRLLRVAN